uniref:BTB domain-containing protein n=1 Tax=Panagrolaimus sp. PS1159 TaxID=55785 RepID=A0AC35GSB7_9BILA
MQSRLAVTTPSVPTANYSKTYTNTYEKSQGCGGICFTREDLFKVENQYIVDGYMNLQINGTIQSQKYVTAIDTFKPNDLAESLWNSDNKDFKIIVDGKAIMAHKCILAHRSKYFAALFNSEMTEYKENKTSIIGFPYSIVETVIKACYDCDITDFIVDDNINLLLSFMDLHEFVGF